MPDLTFDTYLDHILSGFVWTTADVYAAMFDSDTWTPNKSQAVVNDIVLDGAIEVAAASYARVPLVSPVKNLDSGAHRGLLDSAVIDFGTLESGFAFDYLVIFTLVTDDTDSWLLSAHDVGAQVTSNSGPTRFVPDSDGLYSLTAP